MNRGDIWTASAGGGYVGKPRPVVNVQDDRFDATATVTVCAFTTDPTDAPLIRLLIEADEVTGTRESDRLMIDKITTIPRSKLGEQIGQLGDDDMIRLSRALVVFLGLAGTEPAHFTLPESRTLSSSPRRTAAPMPCSVFAAPGRPPNRT